MEACVGSAWGAIASDVQGAPVCVQGCRDSLRRMLAPADESYEKLCSSLVQLEPAKRDDMLVGLYCCDSQLCGVDNIGLPGFDPNVDFLINVCERLGFPPIRDPGPPAPAHVCINTLLPSSDIACSKTTISTPSTTTSRTSATTSFSSTDSTTTGKTTTTTSSSDSSTTDREPSTSTSTSTSSMTTTVTSGGVAPSISSIQDPGLSDGLSGGSQNDASGGLSTSSKIIIASTVGVAILLALIAVLWHCRYRRKNGREPKTSNATTPSIAMIPPNDPSPVSQMVSPTPSYGADGAPLTPPPRLKERRLLATQSSEQLIEERPSGLRPGFHLPTSSRAGGGSPYSSMIAPAAMTAGAAAKERTPVIGSPPPGTGSFLSVPPSSLSPTLPVSPRSPIPRPARSYFTPTPITASLADPGPPPDRELPSTPIRAARAAAAAKRAQRTEVSPHAIGVALEFPPQEDELLTQVSNSTGGSSGSKIMTGPLRGSWRDSWVASDDGMSSEMPVERGRPISRSPRLEERELERMAGSY